MIKRVVVIAGCLSLALAIPASAGSGSVKWYLSANGKISCQLSSGGALGTLAYCQTLKPASSVTLHRNGFAKICKGTRCLGNPPDNAKTLRAGGLAKVGPFYCKAESSSKIQCVVARLGDGFEVSNTGITKVSLGES